MSSTKAEVSRAHPGSEQRRRVMTREQLVMAEAVTMADVRRMAESLCSQSHHEGTAGIRADVHDLAVPGSPSGRGEPD
jgi:hypothetical protein